jgi:hypothetical protein
MVNQLEISQIYRAWLKSAPLEAAQHTCEIYASNQGTPLLVLRNIYHALIVNRITYCLSAWGGFLTTDAVGRLNAVSKRAKRYGLTDTVFDVIGLLDKTMFSQIKLNNNHRLYYILPPRRPNTDGLRARGHDFTLPKCLNPVYRRFDIRRRFYNYV